MAFVALSSSFHTALPLRRDPTKHWWSEVLLPRALRFIARPRMQAKDIDKTTKTCPDVPVLLLQAIV